MLSFPGLTVQAMVSCASPNPRNFWRGDIKCVYNGLPNIAGVRTGEKLLSGKLLKIYKQEKVVK